MPKISLSHPYYLLLLLALIPLAVWVHRESLAGLRGGRANWALGFRVALVTLLCLALAGLAVSQPTRKLAVLFVLDRSDSIPPDKKTAALEFVNMAARAMEPGRDEAGLLVFGSDAYLEMETTESLRVRQILSVVGRDSTNIAQAVRLALASFPGDAQKRIVLLSDGNENIEEVLRTSARDAQADGVQVDSVPLVYEYTQEVMADKLVMPSQVKIGEPFEVRLILRSTMDTTAVLRLLRNGSMISQQRVRLRPGPNVVSFEQSLEEPRFYTYEAIVEVEGDQLPDNNRGLGFTVVKGKPRVLIVDNYPEDSRFLATALGAQQVHAEIKRPAELPTTLAEFQNYDSVVLSNVSADQLSVDQMKMIRSNVRDLGSGLVMIGGDQSFGPGAYRGTPIEDALPVRMEVQKQKVMPVGAVAMVLHTMEFGDGNRWARETAAAVIDVVGEEDFVGVLDYEVGEQWGIPMQRARNKSQLKSALYRLNPGDMPDFHQIVKMALDGLQRDAKPAAVKHIIIISDGDPTPPSQALMKQIVDAKITISTVTVFPHGTGTETMEMMAEIGKGEFYNVTQPEEIPRIFLKEAQRVLKPAIIEEPFQPRLLEDSRLLQGIESTPPLLGYVATTPKEAPGVEVAMVSDRDDPVLASWRYGLGRSVAFTSDAKNRWAAPWLANWGANFTRFWAQTVRWTIRSTARAELDAQVDIRQQQGQIVVDAIDARGNFINGLDLRGSVASPNHSLKLRLDQTAPGRYEGRFSAPEKGQYMISLAYMDDQGIQRLHTIGAAIPYSPEYQELTANSSVMTNLAEQTGGKLWPTPAAEMKPNDTREMFRHDRASHTAPNELWPLLLLLAALLLPFDVAVRRLAITPMEVWQWAQARIAVARTGRRRHGAAREREPAMDRLFEAKEAASQRITSDDEAVSFRERLRDRATTGPAAPPPPTSTVASTPPTARRAAAPPPEAPPSPAAAAPESTPAAAEEPIGSSELTDRLLRLKRRRRDKRD